jgi:phenylacetate-CoA ligase
MGPNQLSTETRLIEAFRRAARLPWYKTLLDEHGVDAAGVTDAASFSRACPLLTKRNTFQRFPIDQLSPTTPVAALATLLTSSGHGGSFSFGLSTRAQAAAAARAIDGALDAAFHVGSRSTLAVNCLPMGVGFASECMTVATTSVREDMAVALVEAFGRSYDQILLVADPLFMQRLVGHAAARGVNWSDYRVQVVLGEEIFGEHFRRYLATSLGHDLDRPERGHIISSFGVGELGLHLLFETPATIAVRRASAADSGLAQALLGVPSRVQALPMIFSFDPERTFIEVDEPGAAGYGKLTISLLEAGMPIPLLRYQTGDIVRVLDREDVTDALQRRGLAVPPDLPSHLLALEGRDRDSLPNQSHLGVYKDALYADHLVATRVTGAFRIVFVEAACTLHVQLAAAAVPSAGMEQRLLDALPAPLRSTRLVFWPYHRFPFGMTLDYERKFTYYVAGERAAPQDQERCGRALQAALAAGSDDPVAADNGIHSL